MMHNRPASTHDAVFVDVVAPTNAVSASIIDALAVHVSKGC